MTEDVQFASIDKAEIFASGTWNGLKFNEDDLDNMVKAFDALNSSGRVPLKLGHTGPDVRDDPTTQFAMGWVQRIWREGRKLFADFEVPDAVFKLIKQGMLKFVSVELLKDVKVSNREIPWVLDAVALLGSDAPAVGILKDLQALTMARSTDSLPCRERLVFARADYIPSQSGDTIRMSKENEGGQPTIQEVLEKVVALTNEISAVKDENRRLKEEKATFSQTRQRLTDLEASVARDKAAAHRALIKAEFERAIKDEEIVPAARERFNKIYRIDDDEVIMAVSLEDVKEFIRENPNPIPKRKPKATGFSLDRADGNVPPGTRPDEETLMRAKALLKSENIHQPNWQQLNDAVKRVFRAQTDLGERYKFMPDDLSRDSRAA